MTTTELLLDTSTLFDPTDSHSMRHGAGYHVRLATTQSDVVAAQRLRFEVFRSEGGATTPGPNGPNPQVGLHTHDRDCAGRPDSEEFDDRCDHLIVWHQSPGGPPNAVATLRLLPPHCNDASPRGTGLATDLEFGLMPLERLLDSAVEIGHACVRADHRAGTAVSLLLGGAARYLHLTGYHYLLGCAPIGLEDGGHNAASFWDFALNGHLAPAERRCRPRDPIAIGSLQRADHPHIPALIRGALRLGAKVCGPPSCNDIFDTADFLLMLDMQDLDRRYLRRLLGDG